MAGDTAHPAGDPMAAGPGRRRPRRLAPGRHAGAPWLPATACASDRPVRRSPMASSLPVQRLTGDAWWARVARQSWLGWGLLPRQGTCSTLLGGFLMSNERNYDTERLPDTN